MELQITSNNNKVDAMEKSHNQFSANFINPAKEVDAKVFLMTQRLEQTELMQESHFTILSDSLRKLIYAMESANMGAYGTNKSMLGLVMASANLAGNQQFANINHLATEGSYTSDEQENLNHIQSVQ